MNKIKKITKHLACSLLGAIGILLVSGFLCSASAQLTVTFFDCGKADSALVQQAGHTMLIDAGMDADGTYIVERMLKLGVEKLDYLVLTHADKDHIGGADHVLEAFDTQTALRGPDANNSKQVKQYYTVLHEKETKERFPQVGAVFSLGEAQITVLGPLSTQYVQENDLSLVLRIDYGQTSFLFAADAEREAIDDMLDGLPPEQLDANVLKVPHHGNGKKNSPAFFQAVGADIAVIPCQRGTEDGLPEAQVEMALEALGATTYITGDGDVVIISDGQKLQAEQLAKTR